MGEGEDGGEEEVMLYWHYTTGACLLQIIMDGVIRPATARVPENERPIVWFSTRTDWEPTANKTLMSNDGLMGRATLEEMERLAGGLARIGVVPETAPYNWYQLKRQSGMASGMGRHLERAALAVRSFTGDWRGTFDPVPREKWLAIELFRDGEWEPFGAQ